jgi:pimeloyl-ACP methyl ester carboxylesterase
VIDAILDGLIAWPERITRAGLRTAGYRSRRVHTRYGDVVALQARGGGRVPLMLLHGFAAEGAHYAPLMRRLRPHVSRLIVPDLPGHGGSAPPSSPLVPHELRKEIVAAFDQLIDEPTALFGNSLGGLLALDYALSRPERVRRLILCSPVGAPTSDAELSALLRLFQLGGYEDALAFVDRLFVRPTILRRLVAWGVLRKFADPKLQELLLGLRPTDMIDPAELGALRVPTLLIWGQEDRILPRSSLEFFRRHLPAHVQIEEPPAQSHTPYLEDPRGVASRILAFLGEDPAAAGAGVG